MSYQSRPIIKHRVPRYGRPPLGGITDFLASLNEQITGTPSESSQCLANANAMTAALDAKTQDLQKTWLPTGYYSPDQVQQLGTNTLAMLRSAVDVVQQAISDPQAPGSRDALTQVMDDLNRAMSDSLQFSQAVGQANAQGIEVIDSPGLKRWIVNAMTTTSSALAAAAYIACMTPWWVSALAKFQSAFDAVWNLAKQIAGVILQVGQAVLKIPDMIGTLWTIAKWAAVIGAGYFVAVKSGVIAQDPLGLIKD